MAANLGGLTGHIRTCPGGGIFGDGRPRELRCNQFPGGMYTRMGEAMNSVKDAAAPVDGNERTGDTSRHVTQDGVTGGLNLLNMERRSRIALKTDDVQPAGVYILAHLPTEGRGIV